MFEKRMVENLWVCVCVQVKLQVNS